MLRLRAVVVTEATDAEMIALDVHTEFGRQAIEHAVERRDRHRMHEEVERLSQAIRAGHLLPEDF